MSQRDRGCTSENEPARQSANEAAGAPAVLSAQLREVLHKEGSSEGLESILEGLADVEDFVSANGGDSSLSFECFCHVSDLMQIGNQAFRENRFEEGPKPEEKPSASSGEPASNVKPSGPASSTSEVSTDEYRNYAVVVGVVTGLGALGWGYLRSRENEAEEVAGLS